ncbi:MAG: hypothetical protein OXT09_15955 [Myxococcales bacterium]|nr:hypothetical protein [Myxococcales bacterium]
MSRGPSPLLGYNTNVRHKGKLYHIQTEDSGVNHPHIITHLFADGGRIIASKKTTYEEHLGAEDLQATVKKLMQNQHKAMFIDLRDCVYDEDEAAPDAAKTNGEAEGAPAEPAPPVAAPEPVLDVEALERAAEAKIAESAAARVQAGGRRAGRYQQTVAARASSRAETSMPHPDASIFSGQVLRGKSLDDVILSYLSDDADEE